jgi:hypothetical protein
MSQEESRLDHVPEIKKKLTIQKSRDTTTKQKIPTHSEIVDRILRAKFQNNLVFFAPNEKVILTGSLVPGLISVKLCARKFE